ncbi:hypothetical protein QQF64_020737 [Cirrhinus molitorella]|uniref:Phorbol-ester/DAG-type domain-containing protein n=1 Tax=Cirrhinus molitorella TaxID=172907 RepID=A0ABR3LDH2_9TELE
MLPTRIPAQPKALQSCGFPRFPAMVVVPGKGEGPQVSGQKQLLLCARETSSRESERAETDQQGPDLYMGCALSADSCGDEPDPVPVKGSLRRERAKSRGNMRLTKTGKGEPHVFKEKTFKKKRQCGVCRQSVENLGSFCRVCKTATHKKCEAKASLFWGGSVGSRTPAPHSLSERLIDKASRCQRWHTHIRHGSRGAPWDLESQAVCFIHSC